MYNDYLLHFEENNWDTTLDRIDWKWNYCKENCRWLTQKLQTYNSARNIYITYKKKTQTVMEWSQELNMTYSSTKHRFRNLITHNE